MSSMWAESRGGLQRDNPEVGRLCSNRCAARLPENPNSDLDSEVEEVEEGVGSGRAGMCCLAE